MPNKRHMKQAEVPEEGAPAAPPAPAEAPVAADPIPRGARLCTSYFRQPYRREVYENDEAYFWQVLRKREVIGSGSVKKTGDTAEDMSQVNAGLDAVEEDAA